MEAAIDRCDMDIEGTCGSPRTPRTWSFHEKAVEEGRFYEQRFAEDLSNKVFGQVFPDLARAIVEAAPQTDLREVRDGALILLYRLLFILYAEDRDLLPVREVRYDDCRGHRKVCAQNYAKDAKDASRIAGATL